MRNLVGCHGCPLVKDGQDLACDAHIDSAANKLVRNGVAHRCNRDMEIRGYFRTLPLGMLPRGCRQVSKEMLLVCFEEIPAA